MPISSIWALPFVRRAGHEHEVGLRRRYGLDVDVIERAAVGNALVLREYLQQKRRGFGGRRRNHHAVGPAQHAHRLEGASHAGDADALDPLRHGDLAPLRVRHRSRALGGLGIRGGRVVGLLPLPVFGVAALRAAAQGDRPGRGHAGRDEQLDESSPGHVLGRCAHVVPSPIRSLPAAGMVTT